jgi:hypothetical protein
MEIHRPTTFLSENLKGRDLLLDQGENGDENINMHLKGI